MAKLAKLPELPPPESARIHRMLKEDYYAHELQERENTNTARAAKSAKVKLEKSTTMEEHLKQRRQQDPDLFEPEIDEFAAKEAEEKRKWIEAAKAAEAAKPQQPKLTNPLYNSGPYRKRNPSEIVEAPRYGDMTKAQQQYKQPYPEKVWEARYRMWKDSQKEKAIFFSATRFLPCQEQVKSAWETWEASRRNWEEIDQLLVMARKELFKKSGKPIGDDERGDKKERESDAVARIFRLQ